MIIFNFSHPLTDSQEEQIEQISSQSIEKVIEIKVDFDLQKPFKPQVDRVLEQIPLSPQQMQQLPLLINLPALNYISGLLLTGLHGRLGYFPPVIRMRPVAGQVPRQFEVAEILDLQAYRDQERSKRFASE